jgi:hypothetical protein
MVGIPTTTGVDLTTTIPYTLCQKVNITAGKRYKI